MCWRQPTLILLQDPPEDLDTLGRRLAVVFTSSAQALITAGTITYVDIDKITCTGVGLGL